LSLFSTSLNFEKIKRKFIPIKVIDFLEKEANAKRLPLVVFFSDLLRWTKYLRDNDDDMWRPNPVCRGGDYLL
jgi:hypothetical protein